MNENKGLLESLTSAPKLPGEVDRRLQSLEANISENYRLGEESAHQFYDLQMNQNKTTRHLDRLIQQYEELINSITQQTKKVDASFDTIESMERDMHNLKEQETILTNASDNALQRIGSIELKEKDILNDLQDLKGNIGTNTEKISESQKAIEKKINHINDNEISSINTVISDNKGNIKLLEDSVAKLRNQQDDVNEQLETVEKSENDMKSEIAGMKSETQALKQESQKAAEFQKEISETSDSIKLALTEETNRLSNQLDEIKDDLTDVSRKQRDYQTKINEIQQKISQLQDKDSDIENEINKVKRRSLNVETENEIGSQAANALRNDIFDQADKLKILQDSVNEMEISLINIKGAQEETTSSISDLSSEHETSTQEILNNLKTTERELTALEERVQEHVKNMGSETEQLKNGIGDVNTDLDRQTTNIITRMDEFHGELKEIQSMQEEDRENAKNLASKDSVAGTSQHVESLSKEIEQVKSHTERLEETLTSTDNEINDISDQVLRLNDLKSEVSGTQSSLIQADSKIDETQSLLETLQGRFSEQGERLDNILARLEQQESDQADGRDVVNVQDTSDLERRLQELNDTITSINERKASSSDSVSSDTSDLERRLEEMNAKVTSISDRTSSPSDPVSADTSDLERRLEELNAKVTSISERTALPSDSVSSDTSDLDRRLDELNAKLTSINERNATASVSKSQNREVNSKILQLEEDIQLLNSSLSQAKVTIDTLNTNEKQNTTIYDDITQRLSDQDMAIEDIKSNLNETVSLITKLENAVAEKSKETDRPALTENQISSELDDIKVKVDNYNDRFEELEDSVRSLEHTGEEYKEELDLLRVLVDEKQNITSPIQGSQDLNPRDMEQIEDLELVLNTLKERVQQLNTTVLDLQSQPKSQDQREVIQAIQTRLQELNETLQESQPVTSHHPPKSEISAHLRDELDQLQQQQNDTIVTNSEIMDAISSLEEQLELIKEKMRPTSSETEINSVATAAVTTNDSDLQDLQQRMQLLKDEVDNTTNSMNEKLEDLDSRISALNTTENTINESTIYPENVNVQNLVEEVRTSLMEDITSVRSDVSNALDRITDIEVI